MSINAVWQRLIAILIEPLQSARSVEAPIEAFSTIACADVGVGEIEF